MARKVVKEVLEEVKEGVVETLVTGAKEVVFELLKGNIKHNGVRYRTSNRLQSADEETVKELEAKGLAKRLSI